MAQIIVTITKQESDPWILLKKEIVNDIFSQEEINNITKPYIEYIKTLQGYDYSQSFIDIVGNTATTHMFFDTLENASNAFVKLYPDNEQTLEQVVKNKNTLIKQKMQEAGVQYSFSATVSAT